jgi:hypothetical protein
VNTYVRAVGTDKWRLEDTITPGAVAEVMVRVENVRDEALRDVVIGANLPPNTTYVPGSTVIINGNHPDGVPAGNDNVSRGGINIGHYETGAAGYVVFDLRLDDATGFPILGLNRLHTVGVARPEGLNEHYSVAVIETLVEQAD